MNYSFFQLYKWQASFSLDETLPYQQRDLPFNLSYNMEIMQQTACMAVTPNHDWYLFFPLYLHEGESVLGLNGGSLLNLFQTDGT